jgi:hypothetical protein
MNSKAGCNSVKNIGDSSYSVVYDMSHIISLSHYLISFRTLVEEASLRRNSVDLADSAV